MDAGVVIWVIAILITAVIAWRVFEGSKD